MTARPGRCIPVTFTTLALMFLLAATCRAVDLGPFPQPQLAEQILEASGIQGGLIVHVGCGDGKLTAALRVSDRCLVQGLDTDPANVSAARKYITNAGRYGKVSVAEWSGARLPYADNLVNLLVVSGPSTIDKREIDRVLCPGGVAVSLNTETRNPKPATLFRKPWPDSIDEWTHWLHDASGNAVAEDLVVGQPRKFQWAVGPRWSRHHNTVPSLNAAVSAGGRFFCILDEALPGIDNSIPDRYSLIARNAFNGVLLWKIPIDYWGWEAWVQSNFSNFMLGRHYHPTQIQRRLVAVGDRVYVTLGFNEPVSELDAATGKVLRTFEGTENTSEILVFDGLLVLSINNEPQHGGYAKDKPPTKKQVAVIDIESGKTKWRVGDFVGVSARSSTVQRVTQLTMAVGKAGVFLVEEDSLVGLDLDTGRQLWHAPRPARPEEKVIDAYRNDHTNLCTLVYYDGKVYFGQPRVQGKKPPWNSTQPSDLLVLEAATGEQVWTKEIGSWEYGTPIGLYFAGGLLWVHDLPDAGYRLLGLDPASGDVMKRFDTEAMFNSGHHHRCTRNKATARYLITSRRGVELLDLEDGSIEVNQWIRGECGYGMMPCNGMVYVTPHPCRCFLDEKLSGLYALAPAGGTKDEGRRTNGEGQSAEDKGQSETVEGRLEKGPAYDSAVNLKSETENPKSEDWPTYRHDPARSGAAASVSAELKQIWQADVGASPSAPVIAGSTVFVTSVERHRVCAFDAAEGRLLWNFVAGGRIDTPPTVYGDLVLFGCRDGRVYCLQASNGQLRWRLKAAPQNRYVVSFGQIESAWPVHGSVLVIGGVAYFAAGRSSHLDGGIHIFAVDAVTGAILRHETVTAKDRESNKAGGGNGALSDILVFDGTSVRMRKMQFGLADTGAASSRPTEHNKLHVQAAGGMLDDTWFNRIYWAVDGRPLGQLLVADDSSVYGIRSYAKPGDVNSHFTPGRDGYLLFAHDRRQALSKGQAGAKPRRGKAPLTDRWTIRIPVRAHAIVLAGDVLFAGGAPDIVDPKDPWAAIDGRRGGKLWAVSAQDGSKLAEYELDAPPVYDGMAAAQGRLFVSARDGNVVCFAEK